MKNFTHLFIITSSALLISACGDDSSTTAVETQPPTPQSSDTFLCLDGSIALDEAGCAVIEQGVVDQAQQTLFTCEDGVQVENAELCNGNIADSTVITTFTCSNGDVVTDQTLCPQIITCTDGSQVESADQCIQEVIPASSESIPAITSSETGTENPRSSASRNRSSSSIEEAVSSATIPGTSSSTNSAIVVPADDDDDNGDVEDAKTLDGSEILLTFNGTNVTVQNDNGCIKDDASAVTITCSGDYYLTGTANNKPVFVNVASAEDLGNVGIYLYNVTLKHSSEAPLFVQKAEKTVLHIVKGTTNHVEDGNTRTGAVNYTTFKGSKSDTTGAAIYSKDDLNIKGAGTLTVKGNFNSGIHTSNDLKVKNGNITVTAKNNGLKGKGSVQISGGTLNITTTEGDGIKSDEGEDDSTIVAGKGIVNISGGSVTIQSGDDGIQGFNAVVISDTSDASNVKITATNKGIKSENNIYVNGGSVDVTSSKDDGIHSNVNIYMNAGSVTINAADDGIHADSTLRLSGSSVNVTKAYEGMEAFYIRAEGGITSTYSTDDAWNAAGGTDGNASTGGNFGGRGGMGGGMMSSSKGYIIITGGYHYLSASGNDIDVLDANGTATQSGGVVILEIPNSSGGMGGFGGGMGGNMGGNSSGCSTNMSGGLIDTDAGFTITGGVLLGFGNQTEEYPQCSATSYTNTDYYGASNAAFKPSASGSKIIYGGDVKSVGVVDVSSMQKVEFMNGMAYYYK